MGKISEELLLALAVKNSGGGGGGTDDYNDLSNQPQINGNTLTGNKSASDLGLADSDTVDGILDGTNIDSFADVETALAGKQNALTAGSHIAIDDDTISVNRWAVPAGKVVYTVITSDENYGQNVHVQRHTLGGALLDDRTFTCVIYQTVNVDNLISIYNPYSEFRITLLEDSDEQQAGYSYTVNPITTPTSNSFTFMMEQEENDNDLIIREELDAVSDAVDAIKDGTDIDSFADVETALALKQDKTDNNLQTTDKTVVGAVNELKSGLTNYQAQNDLNLEVPNRKNVLPFPYGNTTKTDNGITFTVNSDNTITVSGEATADVEFVLANGSTHTTFYLDDGDYIFSGCPAGGSTSTYYQGIYKSGQSIGYDGGNGVNLNGIVSTDAIGCNIVVKSGTNITDPITFSPMIRPKGADTTYAPYIPSVESRIEAVESGLTNNETSSIFNELYAKKFGKISLISGTFEGDGNNTIDLGICAGYYGVVNIRNTTNSTMSMHYFGNGTLNSWDGTQNRPYTNGTTYVISGVLFG